MRTITFENLHNISSALDLTSSGYTPSVIFTEDDDPKGYWLIGDTEIFLSEDIQEAFLKLQKMAKDRMEFRQDIRAAKPQNWQDVPWDIFKQKIVWRSLTLTPFQFIHAFYDNYGDEMLPYHFHSQLLQAFGWDYMIQGAEHLIGRDFSLGVGLNYPKCCIFEFSTGLRYETSDPDAKALLPLLLGNEISDWWVLCSSCKSYAKEHGVNQYLKEKAWELNRK